MKYQIRYAPEALRDMDAVWDGVVQASGSYDLADQYVTEFANAIAGKKAFPLSGIPLYYRGLFTGYYSVNYKAYKAFYRVRDGYVEVARILMMQQDYMNTLFGVPMNPSADDAERENE